MSDVNSKAYWDERFQENWDDRQGDKQSVFFMELASQMFPKWLTELLDKEPKTILDWGCAEGDGTALFARKFPKCNVKGIDFAVTAIDSAKSRYGQNNLSFEAIDLLTQPYKKRFDIVFSSNVFEHFREPWKVFEAVSTYANELLIMMVPFNEPLENLWSEHFHSFSNDQFMLQGSEWDIVHFEVRNTTILPRSYWVGQQAVIIFAKKGFAAKAKLTFADTKLIADNSVHYEQRIFDLESALNRLKNQLSERDAMLDTAEWQAESQAHILGQLQVLQGVKHDIVGDKLRAVARVDVDSGRPSRSPRSIPFVVYRRIKDNRDQKNLAADIALIKDSPYFDPEYYLGHNPDVAQASIDPVEHYIRHGCKEGRRPSEQFDSAFYVARYQDVRYIGNPLLHFLRFGKDEGRAPVLPVKVDPYDTRTPIALQLDAFDRGGLEEVVLMLASDKELNERYKVYVFVAQATGGYMAGLATERDITVIELSGDPLYLDYLITKLGIRICNLHYSIFGLNSYRKNRVKLIYTVHNNYIWADRGFIEVRRRAYRKIDHFLAVSGQVAEFFEKKFDVDPARMTVVTNGIQLTESENAIPQRRSDYGLNDDDYVFINVASFLPNKFHADMVAAMAQIITIHPEARLLFVGNVVDEAYFKNIKQLIKKYGVEKQVKIIDYIPKHKMLGLLEIVDCFVMPSLTEGFSIATLEALYHRLPLILSDVGGARHLITGQDTGIIIPNPYDDLKDLSNTKIQELYYSDTNLNNLDQLVAAMNEMATNRSVWRKKGQTGRKKVERHFTAGHVVLGYLGCFSEVLPETSYPQAAKIATIARLSRIAFFAPYPTKERITEGWMSRIDAIDAIIGDRPKVYINVTPGDAPLSIQKHDTNGWEVGIGRQNPEYVHVVGALIAGVDVVYAHTLHLAEYVVPWLETGKIIVDFHGITPEEEMMLGHAYLKAKYEDIEQRVLSGARACVMVTNAMRIHYLRKYPDLKPKKIIILPIVEKIRQSQRAVTISRPGNKAQLVYSGGSQPWQNVDAMMRLATDAADSVRVTFLSHDWQSLKATGLAQNLPSDTGYEFCKKENLYKKYAGFDYGLVLRDDTPVNAVACPTKLYEYMSCGIIPIVRLASMGDFVEFGYAYVREEDVLTGRLPSPADAKDMLRRNYSAVRKMQSRFTKGRIMLKKEVA